jgi:hypothetical protein
MLAAVLAATVGDAMAPWYGPPTVTVRRRSAVVALAIVVVLTLGAACSSEPETPPPSPTPFFTTGPTDETASTGATGFPTGATATGPVPPGASGTTGSLPTSSPGSGTGNLNGGSLSIRTSGDIRANKTLRQMISTVYEAPPGGMALVWTAGGTDPSTVGFGGLSFIGTEPTSNTLIVTITVPTRDGGFETFTSQNGECTVSITTATADSLRGGFRCAGLAASSGATVGVAGTFQASG